MIVFKYFFKILKAYKGPIILYTAMLILFGSFSMQTNNISADFTASKPDVLIINKDERVGMTKNLCEYIEKNANIKDIENNEQAINDALFYRDISYIITIPENYSKDFIEGKSPVIETQKTGDSESSYMEMMLTRYLKVADIYQKEIQNEETLISNINKTLEKEVKVEISSKLDTNTLAKSTFFYNFASYSILAGCVYVVATLIASFKERNVRKRINVSSMKYTNFNNQLFLGNLVFSIALWLIYVILSIILIKDAMFTMNGLLYIINSLVFTVLALSLAFLIGNLISNKNAINGIVNVVALGSSFLCGAFVPVSLLPEGILKFAHILPTYWFIQNNEHIKTIEEFNISTLMPFIQNIGIIILFAIGFMILANILTRKRLKQD